MSHVPPSASVVARLQDHIQNGRANRLRDMLQKPEGFFASAVRQARMGPDKDTLLMFALECEQAQCALALLPHSEVQASNDKGFTALMVAAAYDVHETLDALLPLSHLHTEDTKRRTALDWAARNGNVASARRLAEAHLDHRQRVERGAASSMEEPVVFFSEGPTHNDPLHKALWEAAQHKQPQCVRTLLPLIESSDWAAAMQTALLRGVQQESVEVLQALLETTTDQLRLRPEIAQQAAIAALNADHSDCLRLLLPVIDLKAKAPGTRQSLLVIAASSGSSECLKLLLPLFYGANSLSAPSAQPFALPLVLPMALALTTIPAIATLLASYQHTPLHQGAVDEGFDALLSSRRWAVADALAPWVSAERIEPSLGQAPVGAMPHLEARRDQIALEPILAGSSVHPGSQQAPGTSTNSSSQPATDTPSSPLLLTRKSPRL